MPDNVVVQLRAPRLVTGVVRRCRDPETIAVWDPVPVSLRRVSKDEAPVAYRRAAGERRTPCRTFDGGAYAPVAPGGGSPQAGWEAMMGQVVPHLMDDLGMGPAAARSPYTRLLGFPAALAGASRKRGFAEGGDGFKEIHDDGAPRRGRDLARLAERMLVVGDDLWFRVEAPRLWLIPYGAVIEGVERSNLTPWDQDARFGLPWNAGCFRLDRQAEAEDFAGKLAAAIGRPAAWSGQERLEIADADALDALYRALGSDEMLGLQAVAGSIGTALKNDLGRMPEEEIVRYADLLRLVRAGVPEDVHAWMEANLDATRSAVATALAGSDPANASAGEGALAQVDMAVLRYRECEAPRRHLAAGDEAALLSL